jgi:hypothetical protein
LAGRLFDYLRYGSILATGQSAWLANINHDPLYEGLPLMPPGYPFTIPASEGILGVLFSPAKSLFIYDPLLLPCLIVGAIAWKYLNPYVRWLSVVALINLVLHIILMSKLYFWHADMSWAARYHVSSVHLILVALLPVLLQRIFNARKAWAFAGAALLIGSVMLQVLAVTMPSVEIVVENLKEPVICEEDDWNYKLEFRIAGRAAALYCRETGSLSASCPEQIARAAEAAHPAECRDMVAKFRRGNRLAFFPFYRDNQIFGHRTLLALWLPLVAGALLGGVFWSARMVRQIRRDSWALSPA